MGPSMIAPPAGGCTPLRQVGQTRKLTSRVPARWAEAQIAATERTPNEPRRRHAKRTQRTRCQTNPKTGAGAEPERRPNTHASGRQTNPSQRTPNEPKRAGAERTQASGRRTDPNEDRNEPSERTPNEPKWLTETTSASHNLMPASTVEPSRKFAGGRFVDQCGAGAISQARGPDATRTADHGLLQRHRRSGARQGVRRARLRQRCRPASAGARPTSRSRRSTRSRRARSARSATSCSSPTPAPGSTSTSAPTIPAITSSCAISRTPTAGPGTAACARP